LSHVRGNMRFAEWGLGKLSVRCNPGSSRTRGRMKKRFFLARIGQSIRNVCGDIRDRLTIESPAGCDIERKRLPKVSWTRCTQCGRNLRNIVFVNGKPYGPDCYRGAVQRVRGSASALVGTQDGDISRAPKSATRPECSSIGRCKTSEAAKGLARSVLMIPP
jgi:hypothetical protein